MNSLRAFSASKNKNTQHTAQPVSIQRAIVLTTVVRDA